MPEVNSANKNSQVALAARAGEKFREFSRDYATGCELPIARLPDDNPIRRCRPYFVFVGGSTVIGGHERVVFPN